MCDPILSSISFRVSMFTHFCYLWATFRRPCEVFGQPFVSPLAPLGPNREKTERGALPAAMNNPFGISLPVALLRKDVPSESLCVGHISQRLEFPRHLDLRSARTDRVFAVYVLDFKGLPFSSLGYHVGHIRWRDASTC